MLANHRVAEHARIAAEIAFCRAFEDLALAPAKFRSISLGSGFFAT
jgi:hypothetical protein